VVACHLGKAVERRINGEAELGEDDGSTSESVGRGSERGEWKGTAGLRGFYRPREGAEWPAGEEAVLVAAGHHGRDGGGGFRRERRREWGVKAGLITSIEWSGRSEGGEGDGRPTAGRSAWRGDGKTAGGGG
jgi:hypothetical protein